MLVEALLAIAIFPGLVLTLALGGLFRWLLEGAVSAKITVLAAAVRSVEGLLGLASILLAALAMALLPWPLHPAPGWAWVGNPIALWVVIEGAFLLPIIPGLLAQSPFVLRATSREAQISVAGRVVFWLALGAALWVAQGWSAWVLPGRVLAALAGLLALPAAAGVGPFGAERSLSRAGAEAGLDEATTRLLGFARVTRAAVLLVALIVATLPMRELRGELAALLVLALFVTLTLVMRRVFVVLPRLTLPGALRWCWWAGVLPGLIGIAYLVVV